MSREPVVGIWACEDLQAGQEAFGTYPEEDEKSLECSEQRRDLTLLPEKDRS